MRAMIEFKHSGTQSDSVTERELRNRAIARRAAAEGIVLLKNEGLLPLSANRPIALFGGGAGHTIKGGTGSGDVNQRDVVTIDEGLRAAGVTLTSENWLNDYSKRYRQGRNDWRDTILGNETEEESTAVFENYASHPFRMPDGREITEGDINGAAVAVYVISRVAGEAADRKPDAGDYYLTDKEMTDLEWLNKKNLPTVLIVNTGGPIELTCISELPMVRAILVISQPGQEGGNAVADILLGKVTPSGKLTDTWAVRYDDYPGAETFSYLSGDVEKEYYREGIYVGYRYFDSFDVTPLYPFGFGLSYTTFRISAEKIRAEKDGVSVAVSVANTGDHYFGREVVQLYVSCPQEGLPKEYQRLVGFIKTPLLAPSESWTGEITADAKSFASFDEAQSAWVLEAGEYGLWLGSDSQHTEPAGILKVEETITLEQVPHICPQQEFLPEISRPEEVRTRQRLRLEAARQNGLQEIAFAPEAQKPVAPAGDEITREARRMAARIPAEELISLFYGEMSKGQGALGASGVKVPGSAAETSNALKKYGVAPVVLADGPAGLRLNKKYEVDLATDEVVNEGFLASLEGGFFQMEPAKPRENTEKWYQFCTAFPVGTLLAQSFDPALLEEVGRAVAEEMEEFHVGWWLAPGMNIHRNPLCGRNFEYYSEDPLVSGIMAAAITKGVQSCPGVGTTIKHFACNNQEDNRMGSDSILSERALREIYLRGFEIAVKTSQPMCIMTSYNMINGVHAANNADLCTQAARKEWGFMGVIMTDWTTTFPYGGSTPWVCVAAGNDLIMPGYPGDETSLREALAAGDLTEETLRESATRIIDVILRTNAYENSMPYRG